MRLPARRADDADLIRARLRALLAEGAGWVPEEEPDVPADDPEPDGGRSPGPESAATGRHRAPGGVRIAPGRPGAGALSAAAVVAVLLLLLWTWFDRPTPEAVPEGLVEPGPTAARSSSGSPVPTPPVGEAAEASDTVVVSVVGLVSRPGLVTLPGGSRVADAVEAAGGLRDEADPATVNLAALVADGQQVAVGVPGVSSTGSGAGAHAGGGAGTLHLNTASAAELDALPGIGPVLAQRIVDHRDRNGPFQRVEDLEEVAGIGPAILEGLAGAVTV